MPLCLAYPAGAVVLLPTGELMPALRHSLQNRAVVPLLSLAAVRRPSQTRAVGRSYCSRTAPARLPYRSRTAPVRPPQHQHSGSYGTRSLVRAAQRSERDPGGYGRSWRIRFKASGSQPVVGGLNGWSVD